MLILMVIILFYILHSLFKKKYEEDKGYYEEYNPEEWNSRKEWYYKSYLNSEHWQKTRENALVNAGFHCEMCGYNRRLTVHHLTYKNLGSEKKEDLMVLCWNCHKQLHRR